MLLRKVIWIVNIVMLASGLIMAAAFSIAFLLCDSECEWYMDALLVSLLLILELAVIYIVRKRFFPVAGIDYK